MIPIEAFPRLRRILLAKILGASVAAAAAHLASQARAVAQPDGGTSLIAALVRAACICAALLAAAGGLAPWRQRLPEWRRVGHEHQAALRQEAVQQLRPQEEEQPTVGELAAGDREPSAPLTPLQYKASGPLLVDQASGLISPFASIMPLFELEEQDQPCGPGTPAAPRIVSLADLAAAPSAPAGTAAAGMDTTDRAQRSGLEQQSLRYAASAGVPLLAPHSSLASSIGSWVAALLGRGGSEPAAGDEEIQLSSSLAGCGDEAKVPEKGAAGRTQGSSEQPLPRTPLPIRKLGSHESLPSARSSSGSLKSLAAAFAAAATGSNPVSPTSAMAESLGITDSLAMLELSDWEVSPGEIEICRRPDGADWELGRGGFGRVYKALRNGVQPVAVKVLAGASSEARESKLGEFCHEIAILRACKDPNIVAFLGACIRQSATMLVTEYCEGGSLTRNIMRGKVNWYKHGRKVALDVAKGLVFLHSRRIVHFDLKSPNVLLTRDGSAKIADVGMAKIIGREFSAVTGCLGTLAWASPEMLLGARCTEKSDIYSFGVLLWEICTGETPFRGQLRDVRTPEECNPAIRQLILDCLDPSPQARPSALQLVERLQATPATPPGGQSSPLAGRRRALPTPAASAASGAGGPGRPALPQAPGKAVTGPWGVVLPRATAAPAAVAAGACISFSEEPAPASPFAAAAAVGQGGPASLQRAEHQGVHVGPAPHGAARPPRPPAPIGLSASTGRLRRLHVGAAVTVPLGVDPHERSAATATAMATAMHNCPLFPMLSQGIRRQHSSPAVLEGADGEASLGWQPGGTISSTVGGLQHEEGRGPKGLAYSVVLPGHQASHQQPVPQHWHHPRLPHQSSVPALSGMHGTCSMPAYHPWSPAAQQHSMVPAQPPMEAAEMLGLPGVGSASGLGDLALQGIAGASAVPVAVPGYNVEGHASLDDGDVWGRLLFNN